MRGNHTEGLLKKEEKRRYSSVISAVDRRRLKIDTSAIQPSKHRVSVLGEPEI